MVNRTPIRLAARRARSAAEVPEETDPTLLGWPARTGGPVALSPAEQLRGARCIGSERDAAEAFGEGSDLHLWAREFLARPAGAPLGLERSAPTGAAAAPARAPFEIVDLDGGGALVPHFSTIKVEQLGWPEPRHEGWVRVELDCDPRRDPPLVCTIDGRETPLEEVEPGVWRPVRRAPAGAQG